MQVDYSKTECEGVMYHRSECIRKSQNSRGVADERGSAERGDRVRGQTYLHRLER